MAAESTDAATAAAERWTVLLPGPSLEHLVLDAARCGPVVAVNSALLCPMERVDYWVASDCPGSVHHPCRRRAAALRPTVVTNLAHVARWEAWFNLQLRVTTLVDHQGSPTDTARASAVADAVEGGAGTSMATAILWAVLNGARSIDLYGADLSGSDYASFGGVTIRDPHQRTGEYLAARWRSERAQLAAHVRAARGLGIRIRRR